MMRKLIATVALVGACSPDDDASPDAPLVEPPAGCISNETRATKTVNASGQVLDFVTGEPVAGATVEITTAWDIPSNFPRPECPALAVATTDEDGRFGPIPVRAGSPTNPPYMLYAVYGAGRAQTASDGRACAEETCNFGHAMAVPTEELAAAWRTELAAGGMPDAATRGLVAFTYKNHDGTNALGVAPSVGEGAGRPLAAGTEIRFLGSDRATLSAATDPDTEASGVTLIGTDPTKGYVMIGGHRADKEWFSTGCLVEPGWIFLEDKLGPP